jgi:hypothetical protein
MILLVCISIQYTSISLIIKLVSYLQVTMLPDCNFLSYIVAIYTCSMETTSGKKAVHLAVLSVGVIFIASFASPTHHGLAKALHSRLSSCCTSLIGLDLYD